MQQPLQSIANEAYGRPAPPLTMLCTACPQQQHICWDRIKNSHLLLLYIVIFFIKFIHDSINIDIGLIKPFIEADCSSADRETLHSLYLHGGLLISFCGGRVFGHTTTVSYRSRSSLLTAQRWLVDGMFGFGMMVMGRVRAERKGGMERSDDLCRWYLQIYDYVLWRM